MLVSPANGVRLAEMGVTLDWDNPSTWTGVLDRSPCGTTCPADVNVGGSNAVQLEWSGSAVNTTTGQAVTTTTKVSYRYVEIAGEFHVLRIACVSVAGAPATNDVFKCQLRRRSVCIRPIRRHGNAVVVSRDCKY